MDDTGLYGGDLYGGRVTTPPAGAAAPASQSAAMPAAAVSAPEPSGFPNGLPVFDMGDEPAAASPVGSVQYEAPSQRDNVGAAPNVVKERRTVSDDDDEATAATVRMMCDYIRQGAADPVVKFWAQRALQCFGMSKKDLPAVAAWSVFWLVKHCVKYAYDEGRLFQSGDRAGRDRLVAPAVLVRQAKPAEDCDGFTMLICAMLQTLGVPCSIVTVKANPRRPSQWSHVFAMAEFPDGTKCVLDGSHGSFPGWMVPREHIFQYQVWTLDGRPSSSTLPVNSNLHGYTRQGASMRRRGLGDCPIDPLTGDTIVCNDTDTPAYSIGSPSGGGSSIDWTSILNNLLGDASKVATVAVAPNGSYINPATGQVVTGGGVPRPGGLGLSSGTLMTLGVVALLFVALSGSKGK